MDNEVQGPKVTVSDEHMQGAELSGFSASSVSRFNPSALHGVKL